MKNIKKFTLGILGATFLSLGLYSCSNDSDATTTTTISTEKSKIAMMDGEISSYLKEFYNGDKYEIGREIITEDIDGVYKVVEILTTDLNRIGYIVTNNETNDFLYFVDKNLNKNEIAFFDIEANESDVWFNIDSDEKFKETLNFDFIYIIDMKNSNIQISPSWTYNLDKIWKNGGINCSGPNKITEGINGGSYCEKTGCTQTTYRFFIEGSRDVRDQPC